MFLVNYQDYGLFRDIIVILTNDPQRSTIQILNLN